ncbi:MAG: endolytic transglycosylase MltG [Firmicutes bacterium]|nr:endolytic transglycosylase MltG [Bacillota bacterium]
METMKKSDEKMKKHSWIKGFIVILIILFVASYFAGKAYIEKQLKPMAQRESAKEVTINIPKGSTTSSIGNILEENNLIRNSLVFRVVAKLEKVDGLLKAGKYNLNTNMTPKEILNILVKGKVTRDTITFTIPEGYEIKQIAQRLDKKGLVNKEKFLKETENISKFKKRFKFLEDISDDLSLEGFLFPNTYEAYKGADEEEIIEKMLNEFENVYNKHIKDKELKYDFNLNKLITLASIVEREAMIDKERDLVAAVFYNRIKIRKPLESCATVQYVLGERKENLTYDDLEIESKFNTYKYKGLPPGPIASPGLKSILAALNPADVDYLYFVSNGDGSHTFSTNYSDHLRAKNNN